MIECSKTQIIFYALFTLMLVDLYNLKHHILLTFRIILTESNLSGLEKIIQILHRLAKFNN